MRDLPNVKLPQAALTSPWLWGALGLGYYFYHAAQRFKEETENMKEMEFRNVALAMVSQATKMIEHLTSVEATLREQLARTQEALTKSATDNANTARELESRIQKLEGSMTDFERIRNEHGTLARENDTLKKLLDARTEQVRKLEERLGAKKQRRK